MEERLQTEQILELDEEQLQDVTGGLRVDRFSLGHLMRGTNDALRANDKNDANLAATLVQTRIRNSTRDSSTPVSKDWTKPLTRRFWER
jgi:hypothetical protein